MSDSKKSQSDDFRQARDAFDTLGIEEKATFLVEAAVSMITRGVDKAGSVVGDAIEEVMEEINRCKESAEADDAAPKPESAKEPAAKKPAAKKRKAASPRRKKAPGGDAG